MTHADLLGWSAAMLMVCTFASRRANLLRPLAVATNLAFIGYGAAAGLPPVLALHLLLLPINLWRWREGRADGAAVAAISHAAGACPEIPDFSVSTCIAPCAGPVAAPSNPDEPEHQS